MGDRMFIGAPGADPTDLTDITDWVEVGTASPSWLTPDEDDYLPSPRSRTLRASMSIETADVNPDLLGALYGVPPGEAAVAVDSGRTRVAATITYVEDDLPGHPVKSPWLRGRRYRAACRAHARAVRRWKHAGRPQRMSVLYLPNVNMKVTDG